MAKFTFPMSFAQFEKAVKDAKAFDVLGGDLEFAYGCLRMGWLNKQYHKEKQGRDQEELRVIKQRIKEDPSLKARLFGHDAAKVK